MGLIPQSGRSPEGGQGNPLQHTAWRIPWTEEPGRLQSLGLQRVRHDQSEHADTHMYHVLDKTWPKPQYFIAQLQPCWNVYTRLHQRGWENRREMKTKSNRVSDNLILKGWPNALKFFSFRRNPSKKTMVPQEILAFTTAAFLSLTSLLDEDT